MIMRFLVIITLALFALNGWGEGGAFIFIEQRPPATSEDGTAKFTAIYLDEKGLVQRYAGEDDKLELQEGSLPVADVFKTLSAISLSGLRGPPGADPNLPPSQALPGHARVMVRQSAGAEHLWEGDADKIPAALKKIVQESSALALKLTDASKLAGAFLRANVLNADRLDEYRANKLLKTINAPDELDPVLREALAHPFRLVPVPGKEKMEKSEKGENPFPGFVVKGKSSSLPLLYNGTGYEVCRYSCPPPPGP